MNKLKLPLIFATIMLISCSTLYLKSPGDKRQPASVKDRVLIFNKGGKKLYRFKERVIFY